MIEINDLIIKKVSDDNIIVDNQKNNKYIRLGTREAAYLLELLERSDDEITNTGEPLTDEQKEILRQNYEKWGFLGSVEEKKKFDPSNIVLFSFKTDGPIKKVLNVTKHLISPIGFTMMLLSFVYIFYVIMYRGEALLDGFDRLDLSVSSFVTVYFINFFMSVTHELSHASACYKYSGHCGKIGIKLFYLMPAYFCDVSSIYLVSGRKKTVVTAASGVISNHIVGAITLFLYVLLYDMGIYSNTLLLFFLFNLTTILMNLIPFAKFDGYWIIKSLSGIDNLYDKSISAFLKFISFRRNKNTATKPMMMFYGFFLFVFHWGLWIYGTVMMYFTFIKHNVPFATVIITALSVIGLFNCIKFTKKYLPSRTPNI